MTQQRGRLAYFRKLFELAPAAYVVTDADLVIQDANSAAVRLLRRPLDHLAGKPLVQFIDTAEREVFRSMVAESLTAGKQLVQPLALQPVHGEEVEVLYSAVGVRDPQGKLTSVFWLLIEGFGGSQGELV
jgi:PAS domain S-box-containing protein